MSMKKRAGFTLVELLVVIGIIALLIGILMPALGSAREASRVVACLSNLRQLGQANQLYENSFGGYIVPQGYRGNIGSDQGTNDKQERESWTTLLVFTKCIGRPLPPGPTGSSAWTYPLGTSSPFFCPSGLTDLAVSTSTVPQTEKDANGARPIRYHSTLEDASNKPQFDKTIWVDCWYAINGCTDTFKPGGANAVFPCRRIPMDSDVSYFNLTKITQIHKPGEMVFLFDGLYSCLSASNRGGARINARHSAGKSANVLFFDGHAENFRRVDLPSATTSFADPVALSKWPGVKWRMDQ